MFPLSQMHTGASPVTDILYLREQGAPKGAILRTPEAGCGSINCTLGRTGGLYVRNMLIAGDIPSQPQ